MHPTNTFGFTAAASLLAAFSLTPVISAQTSAPAADPVVELPEFTVTDTAVLPEPEAWQYAQITDFEVLSSGSAGETKRLLRDFEIFRQALAVAWREPQRRSANAAIILCGKGDRFPQFLPEGNTETEFGTASLLLRNREQAFIVVNLAKSINLLDLDAFAESGNSALPEFEVDAYKQLYREFVHYMLRQGDSRPPAWLAEGIAQIIMDMEFTYTWVTIGKLLDPPASDSSANQNNVPRATDDPVEEEPPGAAEPVSDKQFHTALRRRSLMPMDRLFAVSHDSPEARNPLGNNRWAKQSYAFVHMCLYGEKGKWQKPFVQFLRRVEATGPSEAAFKECFGMSYADMLVQLRSYISFARYDYKRYMLAKGDKFTAPVPELRSATEAEIARIKGDALRIAGKRDDAHLAYRAAYYRGERDPRLLAALGVEEVAVGRTEPGRKFLEAATKSGFDRPSPYVELARLRFADCLAAPAGAGGKLSDDQVAGVIEALTNAVRRPPPLPDTYTLASFVFLAADSPPKPEQLRAIDTGIVHFPRHVPLVLNAVELHVRAGNTERASALAHHGARIADDAESKSRFDHFVSILPAPTPPAPAATGNQPK